MSAVTARYPLSRNECSQRDDEKPACAARVRYHVRWNVWTDSENISIKSDRAERAIPEAESRAVGESQVQMNAVNVDWGYSGDQRNREEIGSYDLIRCVCHGECTDIYRRT